MGNSKILCIFLELKRIKGNTYCRDNRVIFFGVFIEKNVCHLDVESKFLFGVEAKIVCLFDIKNFT
jgi:hypothetical protein